MIAASHSSRTGLRVLSHTLLLLVLGSTPAHSLTFTPSAAEWSTWPEYCQVRYTKSAAGRDSEFAGSIDHSLVSVWEARLGDAWYALHHHCAGLVFMGRARLERDQKSRDALLHRSISEHTFTLNRTSKANPMYSDIATQIGLAHRSLQEPEKAIRFFDMAIAAHPDYAGAYQAKAMLFRDQRNYPAARETLLMGDKATNGTSPELKYFLGLVLFDMKDYEGARENARLAYELGYPLPGLRDKLARAGHPL
jgi:tetratricopeptide (TPR) repeat protein